MTDSAATPNRVEFRTDRWECQRVLVTEDLSIRLTSGAGPEVKNASGTNTVNSEGNVMDYVHAAAAEDVSPTCEVTTPVS